MIIANWKCNTMGHWEQKEWLSDFKHLCSHGHHAHKGKIGCYVGVAPPAIYISDFLLNPDSYELDNSHRDLLSQLRIGIQDVDHSSGSRTGAISVEMLENKNLDFAIIGHSERREIFNEDNDLIKEKLKSIINYKYGKINRVMAVLCIGETKEENDKGITKDILKDQLEILNGIELDESNIFNFTVAYEPVWAIGSGLTPEPKDINEIHKYIKDVVQSNSPNNLLPKVLYGGSVTDKNAESFFIEEFVDGALVGGASLDGSTFAKIVNIFNSTK